MMLALERVHFRVKIAGVASQIFSGVSGTITKGHYALLFENPNHRKHVVDLLCGTRMPTRGRVLRAGRTSWAIGRMNFLKSNLKAVEIVSFLCRSYDLDRNRIETFLDTLLTHRGILNKRLSEWPPESRMELELALALCPEFAVYITDGNLLRLSGRFGAAWLELFKERTQQQGLIVAGLNAPSMLRFCTSAFVVRNGTIELHEHLESALRQFPPRAPDLAVGTGGQQVDDDGDLI